MSENVAAAENRPGNKGTILTHHTRNNISREKRQRVFRRPFEDGDAKESGEESGEVACQRASKGGGQRCRTEIVGGLERQASLVAYPSRWQRPVQLRVLDPPQNVAQTILTSTCSAF